MIRLKFEVTNASPFLRHLSGILYVEEVDAQRVSEPPIELFSCKFHKDQNSLGYTALEEKLAIPTALFECLRPLISSKIRSYWHGMILEKMDYEWVPMEGDDSWSCLNQLEKEVGGYIQRLTQDGTDKDAVLLLEDSSCHKKPPMPLKK